MGIIGEEPVLYRLDRLDNMLRQLEEMRGSSYNRTPSPRSSSASTPSSGTLTSTCTVEFSPTAKTVEKYCRPMDHVMVETQVKGTLIQRLDRAEDRLLKLCVRWEEELEKEKRRQAEKKGQKKGIKQFVKQCVVGKQSQHKRAEWIGSKIK